MEENRKKDLLEKLNAVHTWPSVFVFKFILAPTEEKLTTLHQVFGESAAFSSRESRTGKYVSITVKELIVDPNDIFTRYTNATAIEGVIAL